MNCSQNSSLEFHQPVEYRPGTPADRLSGGEGFTMTTNAQKEYACFAIWEKGREKEDEILQALREEFDVVGDFLVHWSSKHYRNNIQRFYLKPDRPLQAGYDSKIGKPPFRFVIIEDKAPSYSWMKSVSGVVEPTNKRVVTKKYEFRSWFDARYQVHSSNNIGEFYFQAVLVLGEKLLLDTIHSPGGECQEIYRDLEGADGWESWNALFKILNICSNYLVLRNFEKLPVDSSEGDVDFLCDNYQLLASVANIKQQQGRPYKGVIEVATKRIPVDIRFVGDGYYPAAWQKNMLARRASSHGMYVPSDDDYFFSLLYHVKIHKKRPDLKYNPLLIGLAKKLTLEWFSDVDLNNEQTVTDIVVGYMKFHNYYYEKPIDSGVHQNRAATSIIKYSAAIKLGGFKWKKILNKAIKPFLNLKKGSRIKLG